jgi:hypothetical protein
MIAPDVLEKTVAELATRPKHEKVRTLVHRLLTDALGADSTQIDFERQVPEVAGRIDALLGRTIIEIKSDLRRELADAKHQLSRYLPQREAETGQRYVGLTTDGAEFIAFETDGEGLRELTRHETRKDKPRNLIAWLEGVVAVQDRLPADALNIINELGRESTAFARVSARLADVWDKVRLNPEAALKRQLWARHMGSVYGDETKLVEDDALWLQHTYLVTVAKAIAAGAMGFDGQSPRELLDGSRFDQAGVRGAVEDDFFGWLLLAPEGERIVEQLVEHAARFDLGDIQVDLLKVLYESLIDPAQRHDLGEYYTPDWLAAKVVRNTVRQAATERVLDPSCGSGTFLFQTLRLKRAALEKKGVPVEQMAAVLSEQVYGFDVHPVAVIFARVTYLLGLGPALTRRHGEFAVPVFLGDALQWNVQRDHLEQDLIVEVPPDPSMPLMGRSSLRFPLSLCERTADFDRIAALMDQSGEQGRTVEAFSALAARQGARADELKTLERTYADFKRLREHGRDHIWTFVARNLSRPIAVSQGRKMDVIVGNPPWLSYRYMSKPMQKRFRQSSKDLGVWVSGQDESKLVTQTDLSGLFFARSTELYLRPPVDGQPGGRIAMVLPLAAMTRGQFKGFRSGSWTGAHVAFDQAWVLDNQDIQPLFRVPTCVLFATRSVMPKPIPTRATTFVGRLPNGRKDASEAEAARYVTVYATEAPTVVSFKKGSPYRERFTNGATLYPRLLCLIERVAAGRIGTNAAAPIVRSEDRDRKGVWKTVAPLEGPVEAQFIRPVLLGESIAPFRVLGASEGVIPMLPGGDMLNADTAGQRGLPHLSRWLEQAERLWRTHGSGRVAFTEQLNHIGKLNAQARPNLIRVVFSKSGTLPAAAIVKRPEAVIDHKLYWAPVETLSEAAYLTAILNSDAARLRIAHMQSRGEQGARDFDKLFFTLPITRFDEKDALHQDLARAGARAESLAARVAVDPDQPFTRARSLIRRALADDGVSGEIDHLVNRLLGPDDTASRAPRLARRNPAERDRMMAEAEAWIARHKDDPAEIRLAEEAEYIQAVSGGLEP